MKVTEKQVRLIGIKAIRLLINAQQLLNAIRDIAYPSGDFVWEFLNGKFYSQTKYEGENVTVSVEMERLEKKTYLHFTLTKVTEANAFAIFTLQAYFEAGLPQCIMFVPNADSLSVSWDFCESVLDSLSAIVPQK